jgi:thiol-disulfide isomerase/thioredoxin
VLPGKVAFAVAASLIAAPLICLGDTKTQAGEVSKLDALHSRLTRGAMAKFRFLENPRSAPAVEFAMPSGQRVPLSSLRGKLILINVWASWCPPCREEMPSLARLARLLDADAISVVTLSIDKQPADALRFLRAHDASSLPLYVDPEAKIAETLGAVGVPVSILIDAEGREIGRLRGSADWSSEEAVLLIRAVLRESRTRAD